MPALVTVPGVEIARVGTWHASTGVWTCTEEQLAAAVAAQTDPAFRAPVLKLGHDGFPDVDALPAIGRLQDLRLTPDGQGLLADLVGVPAWLAEVMASAYPSRSVEARLGVITDEGRSYAMVVTGLALLGVTAPAIESLADVAALYGQDTTVDRWVAAMSVAATIGGDPMTSATSMIVHSTSSGGTQTQRVLASASLDQLQAQFDEWKDTTPLTDWSWIREIRTDVVIVDDDQGHLWSVPWSETNGVFTFGPLTRVTVTYSPVADTPIAAAAHAMSIPLRYVRGRVVAEASTQPKERTMADLAATMRERLGLAADADEDAVLAAVTRLQEAKESAPGSTPAPTPPSTDGQSTKQDEPAPLPVAASAVPGLSELIAREVKAATAPLLTQIGSMSADLAARNQREADGVKTTVLAAALTSGKIAPADEAAWSKRYDDAPGVITDILASMAPGTAVPVAASLRGHLDSGPATSDDALYAELYPTSKAGV